MLSSGSAAQNRGRLEKPDLAGGPGQQEEADEDEQGLAVTTLAWSIQRFLIATTLLVVGSSLS
jgi:hypothetical protein